MALLEEGAREALGDVVARVLRRNASDGRDEDLDCTLLTWRGRPPYATNSYLRFIFKLLVNTCQLLLSAVIFYINKLNECFINNFTRLELLLLNAIIKV